MEHVRKLVPPDTRPWLIVQETADGEGYRYLLTVDAENELRALDGQGFWLLHGPILAVELDTARAFKVRDYSLGAEIDLGLNRDVPIAALGPRSRFSALT